MGGLVRDLCEVVREVLSGRPSVRWKAARRDVPGLIQALDHEDPAIAYDAVAALGSLKDPSAVGPLVKALTGDPSRGIRWRASESLAAIGGPAVGPLIEALMHPDEDVRWKAAIALGETRDPRGVLPLISLLGDEDRFIRGRAVYALSLVGTPSLVPLCTALEGSDPVVRAGAATALGRIGDLKSLIPLVRALQNGDSDVCAAAASAVKAIVSTDPEGARAIFSGMPEEKREALKEVFERLDDPDGW